MSNNFWVWLAALLTLCIFSFLYKENPFYRFAEHLFTGMAVGFTVAQYWHVLIPSYIIQNIFVARNWPMLIPLAVGMLYLFRFVPKLSYLMLIPIALSLGYGSGVGLPLDIEASIIKQIQGTMLHPGMLQKVFDPYNGLIVSVVILVGVICTISYFFFSREHKGALRVSAHIGIWFVMIGFGASFGYTVMARVSLLIGRIQFLLTDWIHLIR
jgi:hypothetical protein